MKSRDNALQARRFEADEKARKVADLEAMIREFEAMAADLDRQVHAEEERTGVRDRLHFAYSTFAKAAAQRRDNLRASADGLKLRLESAQRERDEALERLSQSTAVESRQQDEIRRRRGERGSDATLR